MVVAARGWIGTPFRHMGKTKGIEADCVGLILGAGREAGVLDYQPRAYHVNIDCDYLGRCLRDVARPLTPAEPSEAGDLLQFTVGDQPQHLGIFTGEGTFLHAWETAGVVAETRLGGWWEGRIAARWRLKGADP